MYSVLFYVAVGSIVYGLSGYSSHMHKLRENATSDLSANNVTRVHASIAVLLSELVVWPLSLLLLLLLGCKAVLLKIVGFFK